MARTTPCLRALFSVVTRLADRLVRRGRFPLSQDAGYRPARPPLAEALAAVRQQYWTHAGFHISYRKEQVGKRPRALRESLVYALCRAACWPKSS